MIWAVLWDGLGSTEALPEALDAPCGATLMSSLAVAKGNLGHYVGA